MRYTLVKQSTKGLIIALDEFDSLIKEEAFVVRSVQTVVKKSYNYIKNAIDNNLRTHGIFKSKHMVGSFYDDKYNKSDQFEYVIIDYNRIKFLEQNLSSPYREGHGLQSVTYIIKYKREQAIQDLIR